MSGHQRFEAYTPSSKCSMAIPEGIESLNAAATRVVVAKKIHQDLEGLLPLDWSGRPASDGEARASGEVFNPEGPVGTKDGIWCLT